MTEKKRYSSKRILGSLLWALLGLATVVLLGAAMSLKNSKHCKGIVINISGAQNNFFIDKKEISNIVETFCGGSVTGKTLGSFSLSSIENVLRKDLWIKSAELFFDNNEVLIVNVTEREPVARVFTTAGTSFYIDSTLAKLPLSDKFSARVPVFSNFSPNTNLSSNADSFLLKNIKNISSYILNNSFWMAQIDQIDITANKTFELIPKVGAQIIVFGNADNYIQKFENLLTFYKEVGAKVGWNKYSKINVEYKDQVVAVKRGAGDILQDSLRVKQIMQAIVLNAQKQTNDSLNNIQLDQPKEENNVPSAPQINILPDEKTATLNTVIVTPNTIIQPSTEKPTPNLITNAAAAAPVNPVKKNVLVATKPFWLQPSVVKDHKVLKSIVTEKNNHKSIERLNPNPQKKIVVKKLPAPAVKKPIQTIIKPIVKPVTQQKKIIQPANDY